MRNREFNQSKLEIIKEQAKKGNVSYELNRWFGERMLNGDRELLEIQKQGFASEALAWLKSTTPEEMKYGTASKEKRIAKARESAQLAGKTLEELAEENGLEMLLA
ncbi:hypothetical protein C4569_00100 [Candidatus Parcubacteria bacterium]|nr:MAG: hypothetical protein C4569_00100 [Candidatus Parcubacteria bacterium]